MSKPSFEVTSSFLLKLMKFSAMHIRSEADVINAFDAINRAQNNVLTDSDVKRLEGSFESRVPENLKDFVSTVESLLDDKTK
jgi:hypothetical protein